MVVEELFVIFFIFGSDVVCFCELKTLSISGKMGDPILATNNAVVKRGWMKKQGGLVKNWQHRWFVLKGKKLCVSFMLRLFISVSITYLIRNAHYYRYSGSTKNYFVVGLLMDDGV